MSTFSSYIRKLRNATWEMRLNIRTSGRLKHELDVDSHSYASCSYSVINRILDRLDLTEQDIFFDIGCGKGRVVCCVARRVVGKVIGVEIHPALCAIANCNAKRLRGAKSPIEIIEAPAQSPLIDYSTGTLFLVNRSFGRETMARVLDRIEETLDTNPRTVKFVYVNDRSESHVLKQSGWLEQVDSWLPGRWNLLDNPISFWQSVNHRVT